MQLHRHASPLAAARRGRGACLWVTLALTLSSTPLWATPICRWVDGSGRTQLSETFPERYRQGATCTDSQTYELTPAQRQASEQRQREEQARALRDAAKPAVAASGPPRSAGGATSPSAKRPAELVTDATDCPTWWRLYDESGACFGPFRTAHGGMKAEAFDVCNVVASPSPRCAPRSD